MPSTMRLVFGLMVFVALGLLGCGCDAGSGANAPTSGSDTAEEVDQTVALVIEFDDDTTRQFDAVPWTTGMTVQVLMDAAEDEDGKLSYRHTGRGETAILHAIDGVENQGAGQTSNNWLYWVNGEFADRGFGVAEIEPGDTVTWRFAAYDSDE